MAKDKPEKGGGGNSHQRTVASNAEEPAQSADAGMLPSKEKPEPVEERPYSFGDSIGFIALLAAIWAVVLTPPLWLKVILLAASGGGCFVFLHNSQWTHAWSKVSRNLSALVLVVALGLIGIPQFRSQWQAEHPKKVVETNPTLTDKPDFVLSFATAPHVGAIQDMTSRQDLTIVTMIVRIENKGAPSITKNWNFDLTTADGVVHKAVHEVATFKTLTLHQDNDEEIKGLNPPVLHREDEIEDKTASQPIAHNAAPVGFIIYSVPEVNYKTPRQKGTKFMLSFEDIDGKRYESTFESSGVRDTGPQYVPGFDFQSQNGSRAREPGAQGDATRLKNQLSDVWSRLRAFPKIGPSDDLRETMFSVVNDGNSDMASHTIFCHINSASYPHSVYFQGDHFYPPRSFARGPLRRDGDGETVQCLKILQGIGPPECVDVTIVVDYTLIDQPQERQEKTFRFATSKTQTGHSWDIQPLSAPIDYCDVPKMPSQ
jgi:hypothetical protein